MSGPIMDRYAVAGRAAWIVTIGGTLDDVAASIGGRWIGVRSALIGAGREDLLEAAAWNAARRKARERAAREAVKLEEAHRVAGQVAWLVTVGRTRDEVADHLGMTWRNVVDLLRTAGRSDLTAAAGWNSRRAVAQDIVWILRTEDGATAQSIADRLHWADAKNVYAWLREAGYHHWADVLVARAQEANGWPCTAVGCRHCGARRKRRDQGRDRSVAA